MRIKPQECIDRTAHLFYNKYLCKCKKPKGAHTEMLQETLLTAEGLKELEQELENLKTIGRKEAAEKIKVARSFGDLSENAEYDEAMSDQAKLEARINEIENMIKNADEGKISDESPVGKALLGHKVGDKVDVEAPIGTLNFKIVSIDK